MKILIVGNGGREHAIGWKLSLDKRVETMFFAPGNGGTSEIGKNINIQVSEIERLLEFAIKENIDLTVVGPELPITMGIADLFIKAGKRIFAPNQEAGKLEGSKVFSKNFMKKYNIPTAEYSTCQNLEDAIEISKNSSYPLVIKVDGIAAGKGVIICDSFQEANMELTEIFENKKFGDAGSKVVLEEYLDGKEVSMLCFVDGKTIKPMVSAQDYKRAFDGDLGLNTGGMGAISPSVNYTKHHAEIFEQNIMMKTLDAMKSEGIDYCGILYFGLMIKDDDIKILEFNARFGDPETEAVLLRLETELLDIFEAVVDKKLDEIDIKWNDNAAISVIVASKGYPEAYEIGCLIDLKTNGNKDSQIFHSGTICKDGKLLTNGGRVFAVSATGENLHKAQNTAYETCKNIKFDGVWYRKDIGGKANGNDI